MKKLNEKEAKKAAGGKCRDQIGGLHFTGHVGKYDGKVGQVYYITKDAGPYWVQGKLLKTWEWSNCWKIGTLRKHRIEVLKSNCGYVNGDVEDFVGDEWTLYTGVGGNLTELTTG